LLLLLLTIPPLDAWQLLRRQRNLRFPGAAHLRGMVSLRARLAFWGGLVGRDLALALLVLAMAGPRWPDLRTRIDTEGIALQMVVDVSGSMAEVDYDWDGERIPRLEAVRRAFRLLVEGGKVNVDGQTITFEGRPTDQIGLVTFATRPETVCPLTLSHSVLLRRLDEEEPRQTPTESETNISDALTLGLHRLRTGTARRKVLLLLTDGEHNVPNPRSTWTPRQAAQVAGNLGIPIYTIDAGGSGNSEREGSPSPEIRAAAQQTLRDLVTISGGKAYEAHDRAGLLDACRSIDQLERSDLRSFQYRRYHEGYPWFALAALGCWVLLLALEMTWWRRLP
jgi:Ca-activated chloride channel family protein